MSEYKIEVQNGSGIAGEAGIVSEILEAEGFSEIETANADSYEYKQTEVKLKEETSEKVYEVVERALNSDYSIVKSDEVLSSDSDFDVIIIVGERLESG